MFKFCKIFVLSLFVLISACSDEKKSETQLSADELSVSSVENGEIKKIYKIDVADTLEKMYHGLMGRSSIDENYGLLFDLNIVPKDSEIGFWMKDTLIPLDFLFIDEKGIIIHIHKNAQPNDKTLIRSPQRPRAVLEINAGQVEKYGIKTGDVINAKLLKE